MNNNKYERLFSLDYVFLLLIILIALLYFESKSLLDLSYLLFIIFSYIRIKIHRWRKNH